MVVLGIDQSYTQIGIAVTKGTSQKDGEILLVRSYNYKKLKTKTEKRRFVFKLVQRAIEKFKPNLIVIERIRIFSQGTVSKAYMTATGALNATIVDAAFPQKVYSVDTRCWKSRVCGRASGIVNHDKNVSVRYVLGRFQEKYNDDEADAICISLFGLSYDKFNKLLKEEN